MTTRERYFRWMCRIVDNKQYPSKRYGNLLRMLDETVFTYTIELDENRESDGKYLRYWFGCAAHISNDKVAKLLDKQSYCSVLEMMVMLAIRCENIMDNPNYGDRTSEWFWGMIRSLGLITMTDDRFNENFVRNTITRFLNREYQPDGRGGLFTVPDVESDLTKVEIWCQMCWYLDQID